VVKGLVEKPDEWDASSANRKELVTDPWPWLLDEKKPVGALRPSHIIAVPGKEYESGLTPDLPSLLAMRAKP
jgi:hypothetical protein